MNPVKLSLGIVCMGYDLLLIFQHYVLYGKNNKTQDEAKMRLLNESLGDNETTLNKA